MSDYVSWGLGAIIGLVALDRLLLWMEARGWIYYRRNKPRGGGSIYHLMELHTIFEPSMQEVMEIKVQEERVEDESGDPPVPGDQEPFQNDPPGLEMVKYREYGSSGAPVIVLHGGPGAPGQMAAVARELASSFRVIEPWQRGSGPEPLTVARHVEDLRRLIASRCGDLRPALVGHSWGAMLALGFAAAHPRAAGPLVLVGCGTFDTEARQRLQEAIAERIDGDLQSHIDRVRGETADPDERLRRMERLLLPVYSYDLSTQETGAELVDAAAYRETWADVLRLQAAGVYPAAFEAIETPVLMLHGAVDPHPGRMIRATLQRYIPQLEYHEIERCGHYPWLERAARDEFFSFTGRWLTRTLTSAAD